MQQEFGIDFQQVAKVISGAKVIGLGESTHGTHEFFVAKSEIIKMLVCEYGFNTLFFESVDDHCEQLNECINTGKGDIKDLVNKLFYCYRTEEVLELFVWLRDHRNEYPVHLIGLDKREFVGDYAVDYDFEKMNLRDKRMALVVKQYLAENTLAKAVVWAHDTHIAAYVNAPLSYKNQFKPMGRHLRRWFKKGYFNVALLFGDGQFRSESIENSGVSIKGKLDIHEVPPLTDDFWEYKFKEKFKQPIFLNNKALKDIAKPHEIHKLRSLGWGVNPNEINSAFVWFDLYHAYDAIIYYPIAKASRTLRV